MKKGSLIKTNPHLVDEKKRHQAFARTASSSLAIEGIHVKFKKSAKGTSSSKVKAYRVPAKSAAKQK